MFNQLISQAAWFSNLVHINPDIFHSVIFYVFMTISLINLVHIGLYLIGANYYDMLGFKSARLRREGLRYQPTVSVLIPAHNEEQSIIRCINSVRASTARHLEIVVIDDASTDRTVELVQDYIRKNTSFSHTVRLIRRIKNAGKASALNYALNQGLKGELVMTLDADSLIHKDAIQNAIEKFRDPTVVGVAANVRVAGSRSILALVQKFEYMVGYRSKKFYSISNSEFIVGGVASTYRYDVLKSVGFYDDDVQTEDIALSLKVTSLGNRHYRLVYGADVLAMTEGVQSFKALLKQRYRWKLGSLQALLKHKGLFMNLRSRYSRTLTFYRIPMAFLGELIVLIEPLLIAYTIYLSIQALSPQAFIGAYIFISIYLLWSVWPDEHMPIRDKIKMTACTPLMYFLFYIMNIVQLYAVIRCIFNFKKVLRRVPTSSVWTSPERSGITAKVSVVN